MKNRRLCLSIFQAIMYGIFLSACGNTSLVTASPGASVDKDEYILGAEDVIEISVWKEPDLSKVVTIRPDGKISLPLAGDIQAAGLTAEQLTEKIQEALTNYVEDPTVSVTVQQINSLKIFIQGEVTHPGVYELKSNLNVLQALSLAGGFTEWAKKDRVVIFRKDGDRVVSIPVNYKKIISGEDPGQNIPLQRGDTIVVP